MGTVWASIGSTLGATAAFLVSRYVARGMVEGWAQSNPVFKKIDDGVAAQGWRMLMITRLVPLFPFQRAELRLRADEGGPSDIRPGLVGLHVARLDRLHLYGRRHRERPGGLGKTFMYLGIGAVVFVIISLIPGWIKKRSKLAFPEKDDPSN